MIDRVAITFLAITSLVGCDTKSLVHVKHSQHPEQFQQVSSVDRAAAFYSHLTFFVKIDRRAQAVEQSGGQIVEYRNEPVFWATYFAPEQKFYILANRQDTIRTGTWRIEDNDRGGIYPELCYTIDSPVDRDRETCLSPYDIFGEAIEHKHVHRGDTFDLASGRIPDALKNAEATTSLISILEAQGVAPTNLATVRSSDFD